MKPAMLLLFLGVAGYAQTRPGQCGEPRTMASNPEMTRPDALPSRGSSDAVAAKPENSRTSVRILPQILYRKPSRLPGASCWCGTVAAGALVSGVPTQEVPIVTGLGGNFRFDHLLLQESKRFTSEVVTGLVVSAGLPVRDDNLVHNFPLMSPDAPQNFVLEIPEPPVLTGTYNLVLKFAGTSPLAIAGSSNFASGALNWEVCGYQVHR